MSRVRQVLATLALIGLCFAVAMAALAWTIIETIACPREDT